MSVNKNTNKLQQFFLLLTPCPAKTKEDPHKQCGPAAPGGEAALVVCPQGHIRGNAGRRPYERMVSGTLSDSE